MTDRAMRISSDSGKLLALTVASVLISTLFVLVGPTSPNIRIILEIRLPRVLTGFLDGAVLAMSASYLQALFLNSLVSPYTLGTASMASLGAAAAMFFSLPVLPGALLAVAVNGVLLHLVGMRMSWDRSRLVLSGVALSFIAGSAVMFLQYAAPYTTALTTVHWLMGDLAFADLGSAVLLAGAFVILLSVLRGATALDIMSLGDQEAMASGVNPGILSIIVISAVSVSVGVAVAAGGPIPFVGLISPHMARRLGFTRTGHNALAATAIGGLLLVASDALARVLLPGEVPVGIITSLMGAPFFLYLALRRR